MQSCPQFHKRNQISEIHVHRSEAKYFCTYKMVEENGGDKEHLSIIHLRSAGEQLYFNVLKCRPRKTKVIENGLHEVTKELKNTYDLFVVVLTKYKDKIHKINEKLATNMPIKVGYTFFSKKLRGN